jgi:SAM-dependent methyltransferase
MHFAILFLVAVGATEVRSLASSSSSSPSSTPPPSRQLCRKQQPIGRVTALDRTKIDTKVDSEMYREPRFVTHTDDKFIRQLTDLYESVLVSSLLSSSSSSSSSSTITNNEKTVVILDLMSSHVSHLPAINSNNNSKVKRVDVHGMNRKELEANPARQSTSGKALVRDLNANSSLLGLCDTNDYDAVFCCVGVQYLEEPEAVFAEIGRVLKPGGTCVISFSNRFFYQKALVGWIERGMNERARLVTDYFRAAGGFDQDSIRIIGNGTNALTQLMSVGGFGGDPFVAVVATASCLDDKTTTGSNQDS